MVIIYPQHIEL